LANNNKISSKFDSNKLLTVAYLWALKLLPETAEESASSSTSPAIARSTNLHTYIFI